MRARGLGDVYKGQWPSRAIEVDPLVGCNATDDIQEFTTVVSVDLEVDCSLIDSDIPLMEQAFVDTSNWLSESLYCDPSGRRLYTVAVAKRGPQTVSLIHPIRLTYFRAVL